MGVQLGRRGSCSAKFSQPLLLHSVRSGIQRALYAVSTCKEVVKLKVSKQISRSQHDEEEAKASRGVSVSRDQRTPSNKVVNQSQGITCFLIKQSVDHKIKTILFLFQTAQKFNFMAKEIFSWHGSFNIGTIRFTFQMCCSHLLNDNNSLFNQIENHLIDG